MAVGSSNDFDLVVLGAGTGGYAAAFRASQLGLKVALVDEDKIGGTCLHRGCIPTKALLESAAFVERVRHAKDYGLVLPGEPVVDYAAMAARRDAVVKRMWTGLKTLVDEVPGHLDRGSWPTRRPAAHPRQPARRGRDAGSGRRARPAGDRRDHRDRLAGQVAAGADAGRVAHRHQRRRAQDGHAAQGHHRRRRGGGRRGVRLDVPRRRGQGHGARVPAGDRPARGRRGQQGARAQLHQARHRGDDQRPLRRGGGEDRQERRDAWSSGPRARTPRSCAPR